MLVVVVPVPYTVLQIYVHLLIQNFSISTEKFEYV